MGGPAIFSAGDANNTELQRIMQGRDTRWYRGHLLKLNAICFLALITSMTNGYDGSMMNGLQAVENWQEYFGAPKGSLLGVSTRSNIGGIVGLPFAPWLNDRYGRRTTIFIGACIQIVGVIIQTASQNVGMFIACRFLIGFGLAFAGLAAPVLITELAYPTHRAPITSLYNSSWYLGSIVAAWTTFGTFSMNSTWSWRIPSVLQGLPSIIQVLLIFTIPESPRWLVDHGRDEQAIKVLAVHHCNGDYDDPLVQYEYNEIKEAIRLEKLANQSSSYKGLFTTPGNRKRMRIIIAIAFFSQWSGNGVASYYLTIVLNGVGITSKFDQNLFNGILQIYNYGTAIIGALTVDKAGRRTLFLTSTAGMCVSYAIWTACSAVYARGVAPDGTVITNNKSAGHAVLAMIFLYYGFYNIALSPHLVSYTVEILPFRIRSKGLMVMQMCVNASLVFNQYVNPVALGALKWKYYIIYTVWIGFEFIFIYFFMIETKGANGPLPLEEIARLFDGEDAQVDLISATHAGIAGTGGDGEGSGEGKGDEKLDIGRNEDRQHVASLNA